MGIPDKNLDGAPDSSAHTHLSSTKASALPCSADTATAPANCESRKRVPRNGHGTQSEFEKYTSEFEAAGRSWATPAVAANIGPTTFELGTAVPITMTGPPS